MILIIAEKPSVACGIARAIGEFKRQNGYLINENYIISWCVGHLVEAATPEYYNEQYIKWNLNDLPIIPDKWIYKTVETTKDQYNIVCELMNREDIDYIICSTDAGREGELIFRLVYNQSKCTKPFKRLWISSMEEQAILNGLSDLKDSSEYDSLYSAALARLQADWIVGMNFSRLFSCIYNKPLNIGRVQTPTINLIVERQKSIDNFKPQPYYVITADCGAFKATKRLENEESAKNILNLCNGKDGFIKSICKTELKENPSALYDLTTLQREANRILNLSAQKTLDIVQSLYEKKLVTYPRTDSRYLTNDMKKSTKSLIENLINSKIIDNKVIKIYDLNSINIDAVVNDKKVTDHHALLPTKQALNVPLQLSDDETKILMFIVYRLLESIYKPYKYIKIDLKILIENEEFESSMKVISDIGFKEIRNHMLEILKGNIDTDDLCSLDTDLNINENDRISKISLSLKKLSTQPPKAYTEDTLLSVMENISKLIEDDSLKKGLSLGTPATRAGIIERIIKTEFIERKSKKLVPTQKAYDLISIIPDEIKSVELTGQWESQLESIYNQDIAEDEFMLKVNEFVKQVVDTYKYKAPDKNKFKVQKEIVGKCPKCGKNVYEGKSNFYCEDFKGCGFALWKNDKFFVSKKKVLTKQIAKNLLSKGKVKIKDLYSEKTNKTYDAEISLEITEKYINYKMNFK